MKHLPHYRFCVVEDDLELAPVVERIIHAIDPGASLDWATSAEEAICHLKTRSRRHREKPYDLVIIDFFLEGETTGLELCDIYNKNYPRVPVLVTSGLPVKEFLIACGREDVCPPFMQKPFSPEECKFMVESLLDYGSGELQC